MSENCLWVLGENKHVGIGVRIRNTEMTKIEMPKIRPIIPGNLELRVGAGHISRHLKTHTSQQQLGARIRYSMCRGE